MPMLQNYHHFGGRHWETGSLHNYYAYCNVLAPHTGEPYSEALFMGVAGGMVVGYFTFAYEGFDPHVALLTRNTFDPLSTMLARLGVVQNVMQTNKAEKGLTNLCETLEEGVPVIVWADMWSLPYNNVAYNEGMWGMMPLVIYGYDEATNAVFIADRANVGLTITTEELAAARARVKKLKFRVMTLDQPDPDKLAAAVTAGIWDCINLFLEKPPKGSAQNWGIKALQHWAELLTKPKQRLSWEKVFPAGHKMYAGLLTAFDHYGVTGIRDNAERELYADFLDEAALLLKKAPLHEVAGRFRESSTAWRKLAEILLPDPITPFGQSRKLVQQRQDLFLTQGNAAQGTIQQINEELRTIRATMATDFPLTPSEVTDQRSAIAEQLRQIGEIELNAVTALRAIMAAK